MEANASMANEVTAPSSSMLARLIEEYRDEILKLALLHGAHDVRLFGSAARGEATPDSDLDILVEFESGRSLLDRIALMQDLEDLLGVEVDVVTLRSLHKDLQSHVLRDAQPL